MQTSRHNRSVACASTLSPRSARAALLAFPLFLGAACFDADAPEGIPCAEGENPCPGEQVCDSDDVCRHPDNLAGDGGSDTFRDGGPEKLAETRIARELDLLFVIDDSQSMAAHQDALVSAFPSFLEALTPAEGARADLHLGVLSTNMGAEPPEDDDEAFVADGCEGSGHDGSLIVGAENEGCSNLSDSFVVDRVDDEGARIRNYEGELAELFTCMATLGTQGCGFEMPFESIRRSLSKESNEDFFRERALLGIVILSDEDDCSAQDGALFGGNPRQSLEDELGPLAGYRCFDFGVQCNELEGCDLPRNRCEGPREGCAPDAASEFMDEPQQFIEELAEVKGGPENVVVSAIVGEPEPVSVVHELVNENLQAEVEPSCTVADRDAAPAVRLASFAQGFGENGRVAPICDESLAGPLGDAANDFSAALDRGCLEGDLRDANEEEPDLQPDCEVSELSAGAEEGDAQPLPACDAERQNAPCWYAEPSSLCEGESESGVALSIERGDTAAPAGSTIIARCETR